MLEYLQRLAWDPTAPLPAGWPDGWYGVLLLFCIPGGAGIPPGVLLGDRDGLGAVAMTALYFASDVALAAFLFEPTLRLLALASVRVPTLERVGRGLLVTITRTMPATTIGEYASLNRCAATASAAADRACGPEAFVTARGIALTADDTAAVVSNIVLGSGADIIVKFLPRSRDPPD